MRAQLGPGFGVKATFIVVVAIVAGLLELPLPAILAAILGAWVVVAAAGLVASRRAAARPATPAAPAPVESEPVAEPEPVVEPEDVPPAPPLLAAVPDPEPELVEERPPEPEPEPAVVVQLPVAPRAWNLWELERRVRERTGADDDLAYLLLYLREHASPDGELPVEFDSLVRESFGDLIGVER